MDLLLITHSHYDHLDVSTIAPLLAREPQPRVLVPLGLKAWMQDRGARNVEELDWWDADTIGPLNVRLLPAQHWSRRSLRDTNKTLWGGWEIVWQPQDKRPPWRFVHAGDTGYSEPLQQLLRERIGGPIDLLALPIGAYEPRDFMRLQHVNPDEAVVLAKALDARRALGVHWGTFELSRERFDQPPRDLAVALRAHGLPADYFWLMRQGELRALPADQPAAATPFKQPRPDPNPRSTE